MVFAMKAPAYAMAACTAILAATGTWAQELRPGTWQMARTTADAGTNAKLEAMRKRMASATPEERKRMEALAAAGVTVPGAQPGELITEVCITPQQAALRDFTSSSKEGCKRQALEKKGDTVHVKFLCPDGSTSDFTGTFHGDTAYDGKLTMTIAGMPGPRTMNISGKWLAPTCEESLK